MEARVDGKVAVVTGASRGIGFAIAAELAASGAKGLVITGRKPEPLEAAAKQIDPDRVIGVPGNAGDDDHAQHVIDTAIERFGACDILINNAGINPVAGPIVDQDLAAVDKILRVNTRAPLVFSSAAWKAWMAEHGGTIVNVGSVAGIRATPFLGAYAVSKAGLEHLTRQLAFEFAPKVRVNCVAAAIVKTKFSEVLWTNDEQAAADLHPMKTLGEPEDVAQAVCYLASDAARWITGVVLPVDGGVTGAAAGLG